MYILNNNNVYYLPHKHTETKVESFESTQQSWSMTTCKCTNLFTTKTQLCLLSKG